MKSEKIIFIFAFVALVIVGLELFFKFNPKYLPFKFNSQLSSNRSSQSMENKTIDPNAWYIYKNNDGDKSFRFFYPATYEIEERKNNGEKTITVYAKEKNDRIKLMTLSYVISDKFNVGTKNDTEKIQWFIVSRYDKKKAYIKAVIYDPYFNVGDKYYDTTHLISYSVQTI